MSLLLDTHIVIWWFNDDSALSSKLRKIIQTERSVFVSAASAWEISTKFRIGKLNVDKRLAENFEVLLANDNFTSLPITIKHSLTAGALPGVHKDPFDRMIIAQAMGENLTLVSADRVFTNYDVRLLWE